ncbi:hypothetical protein DVH24_025857 [Malus domestica]|uniref:Uncharacterized protein n=1 Tax=Malus domestica TaxID=3750 RepID=A0A498KHS8_MALDO|nr:hypothetical protein DVH24_025857 [Malus domestica]
MLKNSQKMDEVLTINAFTRIVGKQYPKIYVDFVDPLFVIIDITFNTGILTIEEGVESVVGLTMVPNGSPFSHYFIYKKFHPFESRESKPQLNEILG